jgi:hypothetical protein
MVVTGGGIAGCVIIFVVVAASLTITIISMVCYCINKSDEANKDLNFETPQVIQQMSYFGFIISFFFGGFFPLLGGGWVVPFLIGIVLYIVDMCLNCCGRQYRAMWNLTDVEGGETYAMNMRNIKPITYFTIRCWHIEVTHHYWVDDNGYVHHSTSERHVET